MLDVFEESTEQLATQIAASNRVLVVNAMHNACEIANTTTLVICEQLVKCKNMDELTACIAKLQKATGGE